MEGKIAVRDGKVYFASGFNVYGTEGVYHTNLWRLACAPDLVTDGEPAWSPSGPTVKVDRPMGITGEWRICNPDGSPGGGDSPAALSEETIIPRPKVRAGVALKWTCHGWQKWSKKERGWVPA